MITKNLKNLIAMTLASSSQVVGTTKIKAITGQVVYHPGTFSFPGSRTQAMTTSATAAGISIGRGSTPATENDWQLASTITSGVNLTLTVQSTGADVFGRPYITYRITVTNTSNTTITVSEIGYKQTINGTKYPKGTSSSSYVCLLDRTVLANALTIAPSDAAIIHYTIKTNPYESKTVAGIKCVSFTYGTDEEIAACIDAARQGTINLERDCGWHVGDVRLINVSAFTGGGGVAHAAQTCAIAIGQFGDYNNCGCIMQLDFFDCNTGAQRMNSSNSNVGGYAATEMYTTTLPAFAAALPAWMTARMKTFNVLASAGNRDSTIVTIGGNKLALRSEVEIFGTQTYSFAGEGSQITLYKTTAYRVKSANYNGSNSDWWLRSPPTGTSSSYCYVNSSGSANNANYAHSTSGVAPFCCI